MVLLPLNVGVKLMLLLRDGSASVRIAHGYLTQVVHRRRERSDRSADATFPTARVDSHVTRDHITPARRVRTLGTLIRLFTRVRTLMSVEMVATREHLASEKPVGEGKENKLVAVGR